MIDHERPLLDALAVRYAAPTYAFLRQVADGTGRHQNRWADAIAMSLWPSRGLEIIGFECKAGRGDWLRELKQPEKADAVAAYCDYWFVVAPKDIVKLDELPGPWGLLELKGKKLFTKKGAHKLEAQPVDRKFLAAVLRRVYEQGTPEKQILAAREDGRRDARLEFDERFRAQHDMLVADAERARHELEEFTKAFAPAMGWLNPSDIRDAIGVLRALDNNFDGAQKLAKLASMIDEKATELVRVLKEIRERERPRETDENTSAVDGAS